MDYFRGGFLYDFHNKHMICVNLGVSFWIQSKTRFPISHSLVFDRFAFTPQTNRTRVLLKADRGPPFQSTPGGPEPNTDVQYSLSLTKQALQKWFARNKMSVLPVVLNLLLLPFLDHHTFFARGDSWGTNQHGVEFCHCLLILQLLALLGTIDSVLSPT